MDLHKKRRRNKGSEWARNLFFVVIAVGVVITFFNLDIMKKGESVFSQTSKNKLTFSGDLKEKAYSKKEVARIRAFVKRNDQIKTARVDSQLQDDYKKLSGSSQMLFEVYLIMIDGTTITTTTKRTTRDKLTANIIAKIKKDTRVYKKLIDEGKTMNSLVNPQ
ncbi:MAG: hypothetical protein OCC46_13130 [Pseudodesulfovibrio sp.]